MNETPPVTSPISSPLAPNPAAVVAHRAAAGTATVFLPVLLLALALLAWFAFQSVQLVGEQQQLNQAQTGLEAQHAGATKLRASLDALAAATAKLAAEGNANARVIVDELRKRGITINPAATTSPALPATPQ